ncbi:hypothetical protein BUALT_Bualt15G0078700 [Buddleja alternifolia]|uniref:Retrotransposon gag domain-containing protein n=1 Tax=Buddleja alternifolia TaxID=168488 RepID=A0AAV6WPC5_9LAMI|nr:hypothetical protein BUALT_Bualt15G0078700 [Buddleja alternifolia]
MVETTRSNAELRKDVDALKDPMDELKTMMATVIMSQNQQNVAAARVQSGENGGDSQGLRGGSSGVQVDETPPLAKVKLASVNLEGKVLQWHQMYMKSRLTREIPNWEEYIRALNDRFEALVYEDPMSELVNLKQGCTIQQYLDKFDEIVNCLDLLDHYALSCFLGGLKSEISVNVQSVLERRIVQRNNRPATQWLVKWFNSPVEDITWEFLHDLRQRFPSFNP